MPFDLFYYDIWVPFHTDIVEGYKYFLTIVDNCSRFTWTSLLHTKSEAQQVFSQFFALVKTQFSVDIKGVQSNNAREFSFLDFYASKGITLVV